MYKKTKNNKKENVIIFIKCNNSSPGSAIQFMLIFCYYYYHYQHQHPLNKGHESAKL